MMMLVSHEVNCFMKEPNGQTFEQVTRKKIFKNLTVVLNFIAKFSLLDKDLL